MALRVRNAMALINHIKKMSRRLKFCHEQYPCLCSNRGSKEVLMES